MYGFCKKIKINVYIYTNFLEAVINIMLVYSVKFTPFLLHCLYCQCHTVVQSCCCCCFYRIYSFKVQYQSNKFGENVQKDLYVFIKAAISFRPQNHQISTYTVRTCCNEKLHNKKPLKWTMITGLQKLLNNTGDTKY